MSSLVGFPTSAASTKHRWHMELEDDNGRLYCHCGNVCLGDDVPNDPSPPKAPGITELTETIRCVARDHLVLAIAGIAARSRSISDKARQVSKAPTSLRRLSTHIIAHHSFDARRVGASAKWDKMGRPMTLAADASPPRGRRHPTTIVAADGKFQPRQECSPIQAGLPPCSGRSRPSLAVVTKMQQPRPPLRAAPARSMAGMEERPAA